MTIQAPRFEGKTALLTGSARAQAWSAAQIMAAQGANIVLNDVDEPRLVECAQAIEAVGAACHAILADVTSPQSVERLISEAKARFGRIDILVNNVGGTYPSRTR